MMRGIDISKHQGTVDFSKVKAAGVQFVIIRAGFGKVATQKDPKFEEFYKGAKSVGLPVGAYWYSYATNEAEAKQEAKACLEVINGKQFDFPVWFDQEYEPGIKAASKATRTACVKAFCDALEAAGYYSGLYCSRDWLNNWLDNAALKKYDIWVAAYGSTPGKVSLPYGMWQYSSTNGLNVPGFGVHLDCNEAYKDYPAIIKKAGLNGYGKAAIHTYDVTGLDMSEGDKNTVAALLDKLGIKYNIVTR